MQKKISGSRKSLIINDASNALSLFLFASLAKGIFLHSCILAQEVSSGKNAKNSEKKCEK